MAWVSLLMGLASAGVNALLTFPIYLWAVREYGPVHKWQYSYDSGQFIGVYWMLSLLPALLGIILGALALWRGPTDRGMRKLAKTGISLSVLSPALMLLITLIY